MMTRRLSDITSLFVFVGAPLFGFAAPVKANETTTYTYDALGRLVDVEQTGSMFEGPYIDYSYDDAGNRTQMVVDGIVIPATNRQLMVLPLNGQTVMQVPVNN